jgi:alpha-beta hydrolase superfamily lysophospholipase
VIDGLVPKYIQTNADKIHIPNILITHGTADKTTPPKGSQDVYEALKDIKYTNATLKLYEGGYHERKLNIIYNFELI